MGKKDNAHAIDNTVRLDEGILKIGNRLQMQLPPDWHIHEDEITEGVNHVSFYKGLKQIGHMGGSGPPRKSSWKQKSVCECCCKAQSTEQGI